MIAHLETPHILAAETKLPNIVILYADDLGFGDLGCYNAKSKIPTPNLDRLAQGGMKFTDGHSSSAICTPSRYALLTGQYHWRKFHTIAKQFGPSKIDDERLTMPEMLQEQGYHTGIIGKWHLGWDWKAIRKPTTAKNSRIKNHFNDFDWSKSIPGGPCAHGFNYYFGDAVINFPPYGWIENEHIVKAPDTMLDTKQWKKIKEGNWECRKGPACSDWDPYQNLPITTQKGVTYIEQQAAADQPYFLYFSYPSPHAPIIPNDQFDGTSEAGAYGDFIVETDDSVGQLLDAIECSGEAENTVVIFSSDNGPEHYAYNRDKKFNHWSSEPLRGLKRDLFEGGHRVPYIVRWPERVPAGTTSHELVSQIDVMATLAAIFNYDLPDDAAEDSHNLLPLWTGETDESPRKTHVHNTFENQYANRAEGWTYIASQSGYSIKANPAWEKKRDYPTDRTPGPALYHTAEDIGQRHNLIEKEIERSQRLADLLKEIRERGHSAPRLVQQTQ